MRKGFTLLELLVVLPLLGAVMILSGRIFKLAVTDVPRSDRALNTRRVAEGMLAKLREDVSAASKAGLSLDGDDEKQRFTLTGEGRDVFYEIAPGKVTRRVATEGGNPKPTDATTWELPHGRLGLKLRPLNNRPAVEADFFVNIRFEGRDLPRLRTRHLWLVGTEAGEGTP
jgi:prepilin-type N-terminal cleavage/methylation domain-containing protein